MCEIEPAYRDQKLITTIVAARKEEVPEVMEIAAECGLSQWSAESYLAELEREDSIFYRAHDPTGKTIGFLCGRMTNSPDNEESREAWIYNVGVFPAYYQRGIGSALLKAFFDKCEGSGVDSAWLEVRKNNARAISFYQRHGFKEVYARARFYVDPPDDALIMSKRMNP